MSAGSRFRCSACGTEIGPGELPFRCPAARDGDDTDHVLERILERVEFPRAPIAGKNPFLHFAPLLHVYDLLDAGAIVRRLDDAVAGVDGRGFQTTPFGRADAVSDALGFSADGGVFVKDETGNVAGSHKARHLFGVLLYLEARAELGLGPSRDVPLAIASCGNAAHAAAVLAKAAARRLDVYVPEEADAKVVTRLRALGAHVTVCPRAPGVPGDPSVHGFRTAVAAGAIPFTCQGTECGLAIEGGHTLAWEMASELAAAGRRLDRLFVQVGGGALASACIAGLREAVMAGIIERLPKIHAVQTKGGHPLERAFRLVLERGADHAYAAKHRSEFMWPWETAPSSIALGILDDETYDWRAVVGGMLESRGGPVVVDDAMIRRARNLAGSAAASPVSFTGAAGLAGLIALREVGAVEPHEAVAVLLTGRGDG
ncbi:MAG: pyridoxal-phosphate dependent enzyme [Candidatus Eiseniibacteriota bacterium]